MRAAFAENRFPFFPLMNNPITSQATDDSNDRHRAVLQSLVFTGFMVAVVCAILPWAGEKWSQMALRAEQSDSSAASFAAIPRQSTCYALAGINEH